MRAAMPRGTRTAIERARLAKRESKYAEFKERFDPESDGEWAEIVKDFAAIANSGGGIVAIGLRNNGSVSSANVKPKWCTDCGGELGGSIAFVSA